MLKPDTEVPLALPKTNEKDDSSYRESYEVSQQYVSSLCENLISLAQGLTTHSPHAFSAACYAFRLLWFSRYRSFCPVSQIWLKRLSA
jgi:hypothetical protein